MRITPISFGKAVKVNAPFHAAIRIANAANGAPTVSDDIKKQAQTIFDDTQKGHALAFYFNGISNSGYILSGKESREYQKLLYQKTLKTREIKYNPQLYNNPFSEILKTKCDFYRNVSKLISETEENFILKISDKGDKIEKIPS